MIQALGALLSCKDFARAIHSSIVSKNKELLRFTMLDQM